MTTTTAHNNTSDLKRVEDKLDMIIEFFNIGKQARRSKKDIEAQADVVFLDLQKKSQRHKK